MSLQSRFKKPKAPAEPVLVKPNGNGEGSLLLSLKQAAVYIGLPLRQIRSLVTAGVLKTVPTKTKAFYIARMECDRYVKDLIKATEQAMSNRRDIRIEPMKKKAATKRSLHKRSIRGRYQTARFLRMTDAEVQDFFRNCVIDDEGNIVAHNEEN